MHHLKIIITKQNGKQSVGKGFSPNELKEAGVNKQQAKQLGFRVDVKRKSTHQENVDCIKSHAQEAKTKAVATPKKPKPAFKAKAKS
jgi:large subunit ribosomal protein L13e